MSVCRELAGAVENTTERVAVGNSYPVVSLRFRMVYLRPNVNEEGRCRYIYYTAILLCLLLKSIPVIIFN